MDADPADIAKGLRLLANRNLIAVGRNVVIPDQGAAGDSLTMVANEFFLPLKRRFDPNLYCEADSDCTVSTYHSPVRSADECYCPLCPEPVNTRAARDHEESWLEHCGDYGYPLSGGDRSHLICPQVLCAALSPVGCVKNQCVFLNDGATSLDGLIE